MLPTSAKKLAKSWLDSLLTKLVISRLSHQIGRVDNPERYPLFRTSCAITHFLRSNRDKRSLDFHKKVHYWNSIWKPCSNILSFVCAELKSNWEIYFVHTSHWKLSSHFFPFNVTSIGPKATELDIFKGIEASSIRTVRNSPNRKVNRITATALKKSYGSLMKIRPFFVILINQIVHSTSIWIWSKQMLLPL